MKDRFGNKIVPGTIIAYPTRRGSGLAMVDALVVVAEDEGDDEPYLVVRPIQKTWSNGLVQYKAGEVQILNLSTITVPYSVAVAASDLAPSGMEILSNG